MSASYTASDIAKWFLARIDREAGDSITHLKLQKLVYYAQAWSLALRNHPLFDEDLQAWAHGPVSETVFHQYKLYGWEAIPFPADAPCIEKDDEDHLNFVFEVYGECSAKHLENMTHSEDPWLIARGGLPPEARSSNVISRRDMANYYKVLWDSVPDEQEEQT